MKKLKNNSILKFISFKRFSLIIIGLFILSFNHALAFDIGNYTNVTWSTTSSCISPLTKIDNASCKSLPADLYKGKTLICCGFLKQPALDINLEKDTKSSVKGTVEFKALAPFLPAGADKDYASYIQALYTWGIGLVGVLAFAQLIHGGILYMVSGAVDQKSKAKGIITDALIGLGLALASFLVINTVNPQVLDIKKVEFNLPTSEELSKYNEKFYPPPTAPTETAPTESTTKCMSYDELQGYVDADYNCSATGQECPTSGQGSYDCLAPSGVPDCSIANYDSPKCASNTKTNFYAPTYTQGYTYKITGDSCPSDWIGKNFLSGDLPVGCTLIETSYDGEKYVPTFDATKTYTIGGNNCPSKYFGTTYVPRSNPPASIPTTCELYLAQ